MLREPGSLELKRRAALPILGTLFVLTGCAGLLAEQCFERLLSALVGASTPAAAVVLAVYFLGLTVGSASYSRLSRRNQNPLSTYAVLEVGVALWSLLMLASADAWVHALVPILRLGRDSFWALQGLRFAVACGWILPPTVLMGLSFPAIVDSLEQLRIPHLRRAMSRFYGLNLAGAVGGAILAPYLILPHWGLSGALLLTAIIDAGVAGTAWVLSRRVRLRPARAPVLLGTERRDALTQTVTVLALAFASGFIAFSLEVLWTHLNGVVLGNSTYAFAAMLASVLIGLGLGGALATRLFSNDRPVAASAVGLILLGASGLLLLQHLEWPGVSGTFIRWGANIHGFWQGELFRWMQGARLLIPAATAMGMVYPALFRLEVFGRSGRARTVAVMGALNAAGCVLGALCTGFVFIPAFASEMTSRLLGLAVAALGALLIGVFGAGRSKVALLIAAVLLMGLWGAVSPWDRLRLTEGGNVYFARYQVGDATRLLFFHEDTLGGITTVVENGSSHALLTNGKFQGNDSREVAAQAGFATVPVLFAPRVERGLVIGFGSGYSAHVLKELGVPELDIAEIAPGIIAATRAWFEAVNGQVLDQPGVHLYLEDGRNHLLLTDRTYDLISMELTSVWFAGATSLYCKEFYELARDHLGRDGVLQQWVQLHHMGLPEVLSIIGTVRSVFAHVELWYVGGQGVLVASQQPLVLRAAAVERWLAHPPAATSVGAVEQLGGLLGKRLLSSADVTRLSAVGFVLNTDWNRYLEYATPRHALDVGSKPGLMASQLSDESSNEAVASEPGAFPPRLQQILDEEAHTSRDLVLQLTACPDGGPWLPTPVGLDGGG